MSAVSWLEALIAISLKLKIGLADQEGMLIVDPENPEIRFFYNLSDSLGNPLSVKLHHKVPRLHDEELSKFFNSLTKILSRIRRKVLANSPLSKKERVRKSKSLYRNIVKYYQGDTEK